MSFSRFSAVALGLASVVAIQTAQATNGTMSHAYSPASKGMAGAGEAALPQDTLSIVGNPAGLTKLGKRMDVGAAWFSPHRKYSGVNPMRGDSAIAPIGSGNGTGTVESENNDFFVPNFGFSYPINDKSAFGVALFGNGGMNTDFRSVDTLGNLGTYGGNNGCANPPHYQNALPCGPQVPGTAAIGGGDTGVNLTQLGIALGYALDVTDNLSLGASFLIGYQQIEIRGVGAFQGYTETFTQSMLANRAASGTSPSNLSDNGVDSALGYGVQLGALWEINPQWTAGISWRSKMYMDKLDKYSDLFAESGGFDMPSVGTIGLAFKPNDRLAFAFDVQQIWYSDIPSIGNNNELATRCDLNAAFGFPSAPGNVYDPQYCLGGSKGAGFGWRDMTVLKLGVQYALNDTLTLRAGYSHGNSPIVSREVAFNTLAPGVIEDHYTIGATYRLRKDYELTFWGMYAPENTVKGPGAFTGSQAPEISMYQYELGVNFAWLMN
jgi:long-chain fatty acid transport protein